MAHNTWIGREPERSEDDGPRDEIARLRADIRTHDRQITLTGRDVMEKPCFDPNHATAITRLTAEVARLTQELRDARQALLRGNRLTQDDMKWLLEEREALRAQVEEWRARAVQLGWVDDGNV